MNMKSDTVYNQADNKVFVSTNGEKIVVVCDTDQKLQHVQKKFHEAGNSIIEFEEWDEGEDKKYIVTFSVDEEPVVVSTKKHSISRLVATNQKVIAEHNPSHFLKPIRTQWASEKMNQIAKLVWAQVGNANPSVI